MGIGSVLFHHIFIVVEAIGWLLKVGTQKRVIQFDLIKKIRVSVALVVRAVLLFAIPFRHCPLSIGTARTLFI